MKIIHQRTLILFTFVLTFAALINAQELRLEILNGHSGGGVLAVAVSDDGKFALTGSTDQTALLWDLETGKQLRRFYRKQQTDIDANGREIQRTVGHEDAVSVVQFSKDGKYVLTASYDKSAQLWETATGRQIRYFSEYENGVRIGHSGKILTAAISPDGKLVATAGEDKTARIWDLQTGKQLRLIQHEGRVNSIAFSPDSRLLLTGGEDKIARLFSTATGTEEKQFVENKVNFSPVSFSTSAGIQNSGAKNSSLGEMLSVAFSPNGNHVLTGSYDENKVRLWEVETTKLLKVFELRTPILTVAFTPTGDGIIAGSKSSRSVHIWDTKTGKEIWKTDEYARSIAISKDGKLLLARGYSNFSPIFDVKENKSLNDLGGLSDVVNSIAISPNLRNILVGADYDTSGLWRMENGQMNQQWLESITIYNSLDLKKKNNEIVSIKTTTFSLNNEYFAVIYNGLVFLHKTEDGKLIREFISKTEYFTNVAFSPESKHILTTSSEGIKLWNIENGLEVNQFKADGKSINSISFSPDGKTIAIASDDKTVHLLKVETGEVKKIIKDFLAPVLSVAFSPDGKTIATASGGEYDPMKTGIGEAASSNSVQLWNVETGEKVGGFGQINETIVNKFVGFKSVAYSPDGKYIAAGSFDGKVYVQNVETKELKKFEGHTDAVNSVKFAKDADGNLLVVSGSSDSTTRIWNASTNRIGNTAPDEEICALVTFRDGNWAVVQTRTGLYDAPNGGEIEGIQWVFGNETIELKQLKDIYYTPNLLPRLLGYNKEPLADVRPLSEIKLFPEIVERKFDKNTLQLTVKLKNRGGGIGAVRVMVNDKLATEDARSNELVEKLKVNPNLAEAVVTYDLSKSAGINPNGENRIEVFTYDFDQKTKQSYVSSDPKRSSRGVETFYIGNSNNELKKPTLYAVVGGVSDYNGTQLDLNFAAKDAEDFANALGIAARRLFCPTENPKCDDKVKIKLLTTNDPNNLPTKQNFRKAFEEIAKTANPEDVLVVYLAGHGTSLTVGDADTYFYLTQESDNGSKDAVAKNPERSISNKELLGWLTQENWRADKKGIDAKNQVLILDTCQAGTFETALKRDLSADQIRALEKLKSRTGLQILMGSAANQSAYEASQYGQGLLTYALLEGMKSGALNASNELETGKWFEYAVSRVPKMDISGGTSGLQSPRVFGSTSIPVGILTEKDRSSIKILESPLPVFVKPFVFKKGDTFDTAGLIGIIAKKLDEQSYAQARGDGNVKQVGSLVYVDQDSFAGAYRITGTYTEENGVITIEPELRLDGKIIKTLEKVSGKDKDEVTKLLMDAVLKGLKNVQK